MARDVKDRTLTSTLFHLLPDEAWEALRLHMSERRYGRGDVIVAQGTLEPDFHVIVEGMASVVATSPRGQRRELARVGFGECIGEMSLLTGEPASGDVVALGPVRTYAASPELIAGLGELRSELMAALSAILAGRLRHANERLLAAHPASTHVICCAPADMPALAGLPKAIARTANARVHVLFADDALARAAAADTSTDPGTSASVLDDEDRDQLPALLERLGREHDNIVLLGSEAAFHAIAPDATSMLHLVREVRRTYVASAHASMGQLIVLGDERWTQPVARRLTDALGRPVVGILPLGGSGDRNDPSHPVMRLARVLTNRQVGLALGAGAAKGIAHIGVLRALKELRVPIDAVSGCSIGAAMAAGVAAGIDIDELSALTTRTAARAVRPTLPVRSFLSNAGVRDEIRKLAGERNIEDLDLPLAVVAVDLYRRSDVTFTTGRIWPRVVASMAIPGVYPPTAALGSWLVDGGVLTPVPVQQCRDLGAGIVIGVRLTASHTSPREELDFKPSKPLTIETIMRTYEIMLNRLSEVSHEHADVNIEVRIEGLGGLRDFKRGDEIAAEGHRAVMTAAPHITAALPYVAAGAAA